MHGALRYIKRVETHHVVKITSSEYHLMASVLPSCKEGVPEIVSPKEVAMPCHDAICSFNECR
jgi:hypothetical protein